MHRFTKQLKTHKIFNAKEHYEQIQFSIFCFSLLLNTVDLESTKSIFNHICVLFLSEIQSKQCVE